MLYGEKSKPMGNVGRNGDEYDTPAPLIGAIVPVVNPQIAEMVYDPAVGVRWLPGRSVRIHAQGRRQRPRVQYRRSRHAADAHLHMIPHRIEAPNIIHANTLTENLSDAEERIRFDVILAKHYTQIL